MKIHFLGTGSAVPTLTRQNLSLLLSVDDNIVLVDCSGTPIYNILKAGYKIDQLSDVIITHAHIDHIYALPSLLHSLWLRVLDGVAPTNTRIRIHALKETLEVVERLIETFDLRNKPNPLNIQAQIVDPVQNESFDIHSPNYKISAFIVTHGKIPTCGFYIENHKGERLLYSADSAANETLYSHVTPETKVLIQDCGGGLKGDSSHAGADDISNMVRGKTIEKLYLVHLPNITPKEQKQIVGIISNGFKGKIIIPNDGDVITFQ